LTFVKLIRDLADTALDKPSALSIGVFDGVHLGHRYLMDQLIESARTGDLLAGVLTFDRHPDELLAPDKDIRYLTTFEEKLDLLSELGLDFVLALTFTRKLSETSARDFILSLLSQLHMRELWIGPDFALGRARQGDAAYLKAIGQELDFRLHALEPLAHQGQVISSSAIRALLREGRVSDASHLLGHYPSLRGEVVIGARRGHQLGFPTANLAVDERMMIPADGIYAVRVHWGTANHQAVVNVGVRPTFEDRGGRIVEAHVLDFTGDLYGETLEIHFVRRLRPEQRFESPDALIEQMQEDVAEARRLFQELEL
jgi:riboflavin kinase/FMN adenylyltransferase